jgi:hypothetical protein
MDFDFTSTLPFPKSPILSSNETSVIPGRGLSALRRRATALAMRPYRRSSSQLWLLFALVGFLLLLLSLLHQFVVPNDLANHLFDLRLSLFLKLRHDDLRLGLCC